MKRFLFFSLLIGMSALPVSASAETIHSFVSDITLNGDGSFVVQETIVYDFEGIARHGIFRDIAKRHPQEASSFLKERTLALNVEDVLQNGQPVPYEIKSDKENIHIQIGDPHTTVNTVQTYTITYEVEGGISYFEDDTAELYWNVTGNDWDVPIREAVAYIHGDPAFFKDASACYKGPSGARASCDTIEEYEDVVTFSAQALRDGEGLTIAQELNGEVIDTLIVEKYNALLIAFIAVPLLILMLIVFGYRYRTFYKTKAPIIAQYEPYRNFKPMYAGLLQDGVCDPRDITAGIVYLAEQGFIRIKRIETKVLFLFEVDDYELTLTRGVEELESPFSKDVLSLLFKTFAVGEQITLSALKKDMALQKRNAATLQRLKRDLKKDMHAQGFYEVHASYLLPLALLCGVLFVCILSIELLTAFVPPFLLVFLFVGSGVGIAVFLIMYERRTRMGYEAQDHLKGFKLFLSVTDAKRMEFHNAPEKSPEQFMKYLPYAIAFGVEKQWAKVFNDIAIPTPDWYDGNSTSFSAVNLTSSLGAFTTSFEASSGSHSSSGGGSSGGGGGGGGGGSW